MIPAEGSPTEGANYESIDKNVVDEKTYYYKLEDIDIYGKSTMHGPVSAVPRRLGRDWGIGVREIAACGMMSLE